MKVSSKQSAVSSGRYLSHCSPLTAHHLQRETLMDNTTTGTSPEQEMEAIQGVWQATGVYDDDGCSLPILPGDPAAFSLTFSGDTMTAAGRRGSVTASFQLDPTTRPKQLDAWRTVSGTPLQFLGIYELSGDRLRFCLAGPGNERPASFRQTAQVEFAVELIRPQ